MSLKGAVGLFVESDGYAPAFFGVGVSPADRVAERLERRPPNVQDALAVVPVERFVLALGEHDDKEPAAPKVVDPGSILEVPALSLPAPTADAIEAQDLLIDGPRVLAVRDPAANVEVMTTGDIPHDLGQECVNVLRFTRVGDRRHTAFQRVDYCQYKKMWGSLRPTPPRPSDRW